MSDDSPRAADRDEAKRAAGEHAALAVESGMVVGLGTGSTAIFATRAIGARLQAGELRDIVAIATSRATEDAARALGIPMLDESLPGTVDLTIDGADEVDPDLDLIKGAGGALLREKVVAQQSAREIIVVDEPKLVPQLGTQYPVPVEVLRFAWRAQERFLRDLGGEPLVRGGFDDPFLTDSGNLIVDCRFPPIEDKRALADALAARAGVVEHGLFLGLTSEVVVAGEGGIRTLTRP